MKDFLLIFRMNYAEIPTPNAEQAESMKKRWMDWITGIAAQNKLTDRGNRLTLSGKVVKGNNVVTNGPYTEIKESIGGYTLVNAESFEDAVELTKGCPILSVGGNVEIREINPI